MVLVIAAWDSKGASLSISPSTVTNDYSGKIMLTISALPSAGQTIRLEKFYDLSTNGVVDAGDPLMQSFLIRDGTQILIGGATNLNVPADADLATNGQITVALNFPGLDKVFGWLEGPYLFRVSSPANTFAAVQQSFVVRQKTYAQSISGVAYEGSPANTLSNAFVVAFDANFTPVAVSKAGRFGRYTLYVPPGDYTVWALLSGYVSGQGGWSGTVPGSVNIPTANIALTPGPNSLAGKLRASTTVAGLPGVPVLGYQSNNLVTVAFTDTNGNYTLKVSPAEWEVAPTTEALAALGCVGSATPWRTNVTGDVTGFNPSFAQADTLIFGVIRDDQTPANLLAGVAVSAADSRHLGETAGMSYAADGRYSLGVTAGNWWLEPSRDTLLAAGCVGSGTNWVVLPGSAARVDLAARKVTAHLVGRLVDEYNSPVSLGTVRATDASGRWTVTALTDLLGNFDLGVFGGDWRINVDASTASTWWLSGYDMVRSVTDGQTLSGLNYKVRYANASGSGLVRDSLGRPLSGIGVRGTATLMGTNYSCYAVTDSTGSYWALALAGTWVFTADCFGSGGLNFQGYECASSASVAVAPNDANVFPTLTASALALPTITSPALAQRTNFAFNVTGPTNRTFQVLGSTNLAIWSSLFATNPVSGNFTFTATNATATPNRSYRVLVQ